MQLMKSIFLGGAAGLVIVSGASAADLAVTKPAPADMSAFAPPRLGLLLHPRHRNLPEDLGSRSFRHRVLR